MTDVNNPYGDDLGNPYGVPEIKSGNFSSFDGGTSQMSGDIGPSRKQSAVVASAVILVMCAAAVFLWLLPKTQREGAQTTEMEKLRKEYLERATFAMGVKDAGLYGEERRALFKWYKNRLTEHENKFPGSVNIERFEAELKKKNGREAELYEKRYELVKAFWALVSSGKYIPEFTAQDQGLRLDIYRLEPVTVAGSSMVRMHFALYGVQRQWLDEQKNGMHIWRMRTNMRFEQFRVDGYDASGKQKFEMSTGSGEPFNVNYPERFVAEFPPAMVIGYYEIPQIPAADSVVLTFNIGTRSVVSGQEILATFKWSLKELPRELTMPNGQTWKDAEVRVVEANGNK